MKSSLLISPPGAHETISISASQDFPFQLGFQPSTAGFQRHGSDLVILFPNGGRVILEDCFAGEGLLPVILLPDGRPGMPTAACPNTWMQREKTFRA